MADFSAILIPLLLGGLLMMLTPIPAIACYGYAFDPSISDARTPFVRFVHTVPTCAGPVFLLVLYATGSQPEWLDQGDNVWRYFTRGSAAWVYFPPYLMANLLIARVIVSPDFAEQTWLPRLSFVTCLLISVLFIVGYNTEPWTAIFPGSAAIAYLYGLFRYNQFRGRPPTTGWQIGLFVAWLFSGIATAYVSVLQARRMMAELPPEPPQTCFLVTAAARGHRRYVGSYHDHETGQIRSDQLDTFRALEAWLMSRQPRRHAVLRRVYNGCAPVLARCIVSRWQADLLYSALKPAEWSLRLLGFGGSGGRHHR